MSIVLMVDSIDATSEMLKHLLLTHEEALFPEVSTFPPARIANMIDKCSTCYT